MVAERLPTWCPFLLDDVHAEPDAPIADVDTGPSDQLLDPPEPMAAAPAAERAPQRAVHPLGPPTTVKHATSLWESMADQPERPRSPYTFRPALRLSGRYGHGQLGVPCKQGVDRASIARSSPAEAVRASPQLPLTRHRRTDSSADCRRTRLRDAEVGSSNLPHPTRSEAVFGVGVNTPSEKRANTNGLRTRVVVIRGGGVVGMPGSWCDCRRSTWRTMPPTGSWSDRRTHRCTGGTP